MLQNDFNLLYKGNVKLKLKIKDKLIELDVKNAGLPALQLAFCKFVTGNTTTAADIPCYIDLRKQIVGSYLSILFGRMPLSGKYYEPSSGDSAYIARFTATISYESLQEDIDSSSNYRLYLYSGNSGTSGYYDLAFVDVSSDLLASLQPGTQIIIEWTMKLLNG